MIKTASSIPDGKARLEISKVADKTTYKVGERVTYTFRLHNGAGATAAWSNKTADKSTASVGEVITYTVQVGNGRNATAPWKNIVMTDTLPTGVQVVGGVSADGEPLAFTTDGGVLTAKVGDLVGLSMMCYTLGKAFRT